MLFSSHSFEVSLEIPLRPNTAMRSRSRSELQACKPLHTCLILPLLCRQLALTSKQIIGSVMINVSCNDVCSSFLMEINLVIGTPNSFCYRAKCFRSLELKTAIKFVWFVEYSHDFAKKKKNHIKKVHLLAFLRFFNHISWSSSAGVTSDFSHIQEEIKTPVPV